MRRGDLIFKEKGGCYAFIDLLKDCIEMWNIRVVAYCLMGNHYHILLQTPDANSSRCMKHIIGKESFMDWVRDTFSVQKRHAEVPESKSLAMD
jgi:REP element-mobilizing transposase RayT